MEMLVSTLPLCLWRARWKILTFTLVPYIYSVKNHSTPTRKAGRNTEQSRAGARGWIMWVQLGGEHSLKPADLVKPELGCQHWGQCIVTAGPRWNQDLTSFLFFFFLLLADSVPHSSKTVRPLSPPFGEQTLTLKDSYLHKMCCKYWISEHRLLLTYFIGSTF